MKYGVFGNDRPTGMGSRVAARRGDRAMGSDALMAARWSARAQASDGSWPYGVGSRNAWIDSFHTSYNLLALRQIGHFLGTDELEFAVIRGAEYWRRAFVGRPAVGFYAFRPYPVDAQAVAVAIMTFVALRDLWPDALAAAEELGRWALVHLRSPRGPAFYYQVHRRVTNRIPYMRWTEAWMLAALADLAAGTAGHATATRGRVA